LEARNIPIEETVPASRKLQAEDAALLLTDTSTLIVARGKKVTSFDVDGQPGDDAVAAMLGPTGNLRAPTAKVGSTLLVGFNEDAYDDAFG
jgi:hypothetical protein